MDDELVRDAINAIRKVYNDTTVDKETTKDRLVAIQEELDVLVDTL